MSGQPITPCPATPPPARDECAQQRQLRLSSTLADASGRPDAALGQVRGQPAAARLRHLPARTAIAGHNEDRQPLARPGEE